jgi:hypothetical protein
MRQTLGGLVREIRDAIAPGGGGALLTANAGLAGPFADHDAVEVETDNGQTAQVRFYKGATLLGGLNITYPSANITRYEQFVV